MGAVLVACAVSSRSARGDDGPATVVLGAPPPPAVHPVEPPLDPLPDLSPLLGRPISRVDVAVDGDPWPPGEAVQARSVRPGATLDGATARRVLAELLDTGRFARGYVAARAEGAGVWVTVQLARRRLVQSLRVDLHGADLDATDLLREAELTENGEVVGPDFPAYRARIEAYLARRGFPTAAVTLRSSETADPMRVDLVADVSAGAGRAIQRRVFYPIDPLGPLSSPAPALRSAFDGYRVSVGDRADETALEAADDALAARLRAIGYERATASHDLVLASGAIVLRVRIALGPRFEARFEGNERYDATALAGALGLDEETDFSAGHLVAKVKAFYIARGFLDAEVELEARRRDPADARTELLVFHLIEHERVHVKTRAYPCLKVQEIAGLTRGGPRSPSLLGAEIDSFLEDLPGTDLLVDPDPRGLDATITGSGASALPRGTRAVPLDLDPDSIFVADAYDRAIAHVRDLYRNEGYLHAQVGPVLVLRRECDKRSPGGRCIPVRPSASPPDECTYDSANLPLPVAPLDPSFSCVPDARRSVECESAVTVRIPIKLGPRTSLYDLAFTGVGSLPEARLVRAVDLPLGEPLSARDLEEGRKRVLELYKEEGFAFADVKYALVPSADFTRARIRFDVAEGERVFVRAIVFRGNRHTREQVLRGRVALAVGKPYRASDVEKTRERVESLNVFSSVTVALEDPEIPEASKTVVGTVTEPKPGSVDTTVGVSSGEGFRGAIAASYANLGHSAIGIAGGVRLSYLPDFLIFDPVLKQNLAPLSVLQRFGGRVTGTITLPETGFGPLVRAAIDAAGIQDLEHDFLLDKIAAIPTLFYRPFRGLQLSFSQTAEFNQALIFGTYGSIASYLASQGQTEDQTLLRLPDGPSVAFAERFVVTWDRRDKPLDAHTGTFFSSAIEHTDWESLNPPLPSGARGNGHTLRLLEVFSFYLPVTRTITLATEVRAGVNVQLWNGSATYPDRLFFLGGSDSLRGFQQDSLVPQEDAERVGMPSYSVKLRGGNVMLNPKVELRFPVWRSLGSVLFVDAGNLWAPPDMPTTPGQGPNDDLKDVFTDFHLRTTAGTGIRASTPMGPLAFDLGFNLSQVFSPPNDPRRAVEGLYAFSFAIGLF